MSKVAHVQTSFAGGELSPRVDGRSDVTKFRAGARIIENMTVLPHGGARKRSGFGYVVEQKSPTETMVFVPFQYNVEQAYMLLFGPNYVWFGKDRGIITQTPVAITAITKTNPGVVTAAMHGFANGDRVIISNVGGMSELDNRQVVVAGVTTNTFQLSDIDTTAFDTYTSGGTVAKIIELTTTYAEDQLEELSFAQTNDVLYIAHRSHPLRKLSRLSHTSWTLSEPALTTGPFRLINGVRTLRITPSAFSAAVTGYGTHIVGTTCTLTATGGAPFAQLMVGALFNLSEEGGDSGITAAPLGDTTKALAANDSYTNAGNVYGVAQVVGTATWGPYNRVPEHNAGTVRVRASTANYFDSDFLHPTYCIVRILSYVSSTVVTAEIVRYQMPRSIVDSGTSYWEEGAWSAYRGYPGAIAFYEQRLFLASTDADPTVLWSSRTGSYEDFESGAEADDAIAYRINAGSADVVRWLSSGRVLTAGTSMGEFAIAASNQNEALTPANFKAAPQTGYGSSKCPPVRFGQVVLYPQRHGNTGNSARKLRELAYSFEADSFNSVDLTVFAEHITGDGITRIGFQLQPDGIIWSRREDGQCATCTYERAQEVVAWHRQVMGGTDAQVQTLAVLPGDSSDDVWVSVSRLIDDPEAMSAEDDSVMISEDGFVMLTEETETVRYIEISQPAFRDTDAKEDAKILDAMLTYNGNATTTLSGLYHLRGLDVKVLNNGAVESHTVSATGRITGLSQATTKAHVGLPYTAILELEDFDAGAQAGTAQSRMKRISQLWPRLLNSLGGTYGSTAADQKAILYRTPGQPMGTSPPLYSGLQQLDYHPGWGRYARVRFEHADPLPFHITGLVAEINVSG